MLEHLQISALMASPETLAWIGAAVLLLGEVAALLSLPNLVWTFVHLDGCRSWLRPYRARPGRGRRGYRRLDAPRLPGGDAGPRASRPVAPHPPHGFGEPGRSGGKRRAAARGRLFGFGVFSVMGLSPFKGSFSKFIILYAAIERGHWADRDRRYARDHRRRGLLHAGRPAGLPASARIAGALVPAPRLARRSRSRWRG